MARCWKPRSRTMTKPVGQDANATHVPPAEAAGDDPFGLSPWLKQMPDVPLHPLMAHPVAAVAAPAAIGLRLAGQLAGAVLGGVQGAAERAEAMGATTAIGFGIAGQMAGAMLGVMQSAAERTKAMLDEAAELTAKAEAAKETAAPVKAKPELRMVPKAEMPVAEPKMKVAREKS